MPPPIPPFPSCPSPELLPGGRIQRVEIAADVSEEHDSTGRRRDGGDDGVVGLGAPFPDPGVGVAGIDPPGPVPVGGVFLSEHVDRVQVSHSGPGLPDGHRPQSLVRLDRHRIAPVDGPGDDEIPGRIEARGVPFSASHRTRTEMNFLADGERALGIFDRGHRHAVEQLVGGEIVAIEVPILWCDRHELLAAHGLKQDGRARHVPVVPVLFHDLEVVLVVARLGVEHDDRVGEKILAFARPRGEVGGRVASRDVQQTVLDIERVRGPGPAAADGNAWRVVPGLRVERRLAQRASHDVALRLGHEEELPDDLAGLSLERVDLALATLVVSAGIADVDEAIPCDRRRRYRLAAFRVADRRLPHLLARLEIEGQHPTVLGAAKQQAVHVGGATVGRKEAPG